MAWGGSIRATDFEAWLPESTVAVVKVNSITEVKQAFEEGVFAELADNPELRAFFKPTLDRIEAAFKSEDMQDSFDREQLERVFKGQVALAVFLNEENPKEKPSFLLMADYSGSREELAELVRPISDVHNPREGFKVEAFNTDFMGEVLHVEEVERPDGTLYVNGYALVDSVFVIGDPLPVLKDAVARIKGEAHSRRLADNPLFKRALDVSSAHGGYAFVNLAHLNDRFQPTLNELANQLFEKNPQLLMFGMNARSLMDALAPEMLEAWSLSFGTYAGKPGLQGSLLIKQPRGLLSLLAYAEGPPARPSFIRDNALSASTARFSLPKAWSAFEALLTQMSPNLGMALNAQLEQYKSMTGLDLRENVIQNLGDDFITVTYAPEKTDYESLEAIQTAMGTTLYAIPVKDAKALQNYLDAVLNLVSPTAEIFEKQPHAGVDIYTLSQKIRPEAEPSIAFAVEKSYLLFCMPGVTVLKEAITDIQQGGRRGLWQSARMEDAYRAFPEGASDYSYIDLQQYGQLIFKLLAQVQKLSQDDEDAFCDPDALPKNVVFPYYAVGSSVVGNDAWTTRMLLFPKLGGADAKK